MRAANAAIRARFGVMVASGSTTRAWAPPRRIRSNPAFSAVESLARTSPPPADRSDSTMSAVASQPLCGRRRVAINNIWLMAVLMGSTAAPARGRTLVAPCGYINRSYYT